MFPIEPSLHEYKFVRLKAFLPGYTDALAFLNSVQHCVRLNAFP